MDLSIVIPAYNESLRIGGTLSELSPFISTLGSKVEVIVVDDGSTDNTSEVAESYARHFDHLRVIELPLNRGKGNAVRVGMLAAVGTLRLFADADGSTGWDQYHRIHEAMASADISFASIGAVGSEVTQRQSLWRTWLGRLANFAVRTVVLPGIRDSQRGFKLFTDDAAEALFGSSVVAGWAFDIEVLALARKRGYAVAEVPVRWEHREDSRVDLSSYLRSLFDLVLIKLRLLTGYYEQ